MTRLDEIRARADAATPDVHLDRYSHGGGRLALLGSGGKDSPRKLVADFYNEADREFYVGARADVPWLLDRLMNDEPQTEFLVPRDLLISIDSVMSLVGHRGLDDESKRELIALSLEVRNIYDPRSR